MATSKFEKKEQLYEGKAKVLFATDDPDYVVQYFKDDATAFDGEKKGTINNKGVVNNTVSAVIFKYLEGEGIKTHFVEQISERESITKHLEIIPVEVIVRNITAGSICRRLGIKEGIVLKQPILEYCYKDDDLGDPFICESIIYAFEYATPEEMKYIGDTALKINDLLSKFFGERGITLVDYKLEFGRFKGEVLLADEITPDGCRLWEKGTNEKLDKDRFRQDLGGIEEAYEKVLNKVME